MSCGKAITIPSHMMVYLIDSAMEKESVIGAVIVESEICVKISNEIDITNPPYDTELSSA